MSSTEERKENDLKVDFIISQAAGTNEKDVEYLTLLSQALRTIDDIYDEYEIVTQNENGYLGIMYNNLIGVLIEAIKEQQEQINTLKKLIEKQ